MLQHAETSISNSCRNSVRVMLSARTFMFHARQRSTITKQWKGEILQVKDKQDKETWTNLFGCSRRDTPVETRVRRLEDSWTAKTGWFLMDRSEKAGENE